MINVNICANYHDTLIRSRLFHFLLMNEESISFDLSCHLMQVLSDTRLTLRGSKLIRVMEPFLRSKAIMIKFKLFKKTTQM